MGSLIQVRTNQEINQAEEAKAAVHAKVLETLASNSTDVTPDLLSHVRKLWQSAKDEKIKYHDLMVEMMRQKNGEYNPAKLTEIRKLGSDVFMMITDTKCRNAEAWVKDILFQQGTLCWKIEPTPLPTLTPELEAQAILGFISEATQQLQALQMAQAMGAPIDIPAIVNELIPEFKKRFKQIKQEEADAKAEAMQQKIHDQLTEGGYYKALSEAIFHVVVLKAGIIKGPINRKKKVRKIRGVEEVVIQEWENCNPFDIFPAPGACNFDDGYVFHKISYTRSQLQNFIGIDGFIESEIRAVLVEHRDGGLREWTVGDITRFEAEKRDTAKITQWDKIDTLEFWGDIPGSLLVEWGMGKKDIPDPDLDYHVAVWIIGGHIIGAKLNPDPLGKKPFYKASYISTPGTFWGTGLPETIQDAQTVCNAVARAIVNNVGIASGPQVELNVNRLAPGETDQLWPWRVWKITEDMMASGVKALNFYQPPMVANELIGVYNTYSKIADEHCGVPAYAHGDPNVGGGGNTASGLSMLMTQAARGIKQVIRSIDENLIAAPIEAQYYNNFELEEAQEYVGDMKIVATGSASLMEKEQKSVRLTEFANVTNNPVDNQLMGLEGRRALLREVAKNLELPGLDKIIPPADLVKPIPMPMPQGPGGGGEGGEPEAPQATDLAGNAAQGKEYQLMEGGPRQTGG